MPLDPYRWVDDELGQLEKLHLRRVRRTRCSPQAAVIRLNDRDVLNFGSNDYLGLAAELRNNVPSQHGWGSGASPMITGRSDDHERLEQELAAFEGAESALLFSSGYTANVGTITALVGKPDIIFSDQKNHASIIDGCRLSGARIVIYAHSDIDQLRQLLAANRGAGFRRRLIVTDSLFSMDGDFAPLPQLAQLAHEYDAMLLVDEAHATGVFGARGRGVVELAGVEEHVPLRVGTLSKALGSSGGFTVGPRHVTEWIAHAARAYFFSTAPPDAWARVTLQALECVRTEPHRRDALLTRAAELREQLRSKRCTIGNSHSQIIPVFVGDAMRATRCAAALIERGLFVPGIRPPSVPEGESLLRISLSYRHTAEHIEALVRGIDTVVNGSTDD